MIIRIISWPIWMVLLLSFLSYIPILKNISENPARLSDINILDNLEPNFQTTLVSTLIIVALIEFAGTILLRHYLLNRPFRNKTLDIDTAKGKVRFLIIHFVNWLIACSIAGGGLVFAMVTKRVDWSYGFFVLFLGLMLFHSPRIAPYKAGLARE